MIIFFPYTALVFAFLASVLDFVAARTAAARPMKRGESLVAGRPVRGGETEKANAAPTRATSIEVAKRNLIAELCNLRQTLTVPEAISQLTMATFGKKIVFQTFFDA